MKHIPWELIVILLIPGCGQPQNNTAFTPPEKRIERVIVSPRDPHYFELEDGAPFIPIGLNILNPIDRSSTEAGLEQIDEWFGILEKNGANLVRVWMTAVFFEIEHEAMGVYDEARAERVDRLFEIARNHNIHLKIVLEHFRSLEGRSWSAKPVYHVDNGGCATDMADFFTSEVCRAHFLSKLDWYQTRYDDDPIVFGWELWNEMNAVSGGDWRQWTRDMLPEVHARFPRALVMQSLGSLDRPAAFRSYEDVVHMQANDVAQVHRYLDPGAPLEVCYGPMDILTADAVTQVLSFDPGKPVLLSESGAVLANHAGPSDLYEVDNIGLILHDVLFAPFFAGAAGTGQSWHWDSYIARHNLWWHFGRFAEAVKGLDPPVEGFVPIRIEHPFLRIYGLKGKNTFIAWCRDSGDSWEYELRDGKVQEIISGAVVDVSGAGVDISGARLSSYDPWADRWYETEHKGNEVALPTFSRSIVLKIVY